MNHLEIPENCVAETWSKICAEARQTLLREPILANYLEKCVLGHQGFSHALACVLSGHMAQQQVTQEWLFVLIRELHEGQPELLEAACADLNAHVLRDPASMGYLNPFLYFKGFHALQIHRVAHALWHQDRHALACFLQSRASNEYDVDIHPAARMGRGIMIDHATGLVIGETAVVEDNVSILHGVTLGGTGNQSGDRHPKIRRGVLIAAGAKILGNIEVGEGAKIGASSLVLEPVAAHTTVAGVPARLVGKPNVDAPAFDMHHELDDAGK